MKLKSKIFAAAILLFLSAAASVHATDINLEIKGLRNFVLNNKVGQTELKFVSSAPLEEIIGYADKNKVKSAFSIDPSNLENITGKISFPVKSIETGIKKRDGHLQSETWLDAAKYPDITFELKEFRNVTVKGIDKPAGRATVEALAVGVYSMHGKSKSISVPVTLIYIKESENTKKRALGDLVSVEGSFQILLKDFDVTGMGGVVGSKVGESINISFKVYYNSK